MSETWAVTIASLAATAFCGILTWIACELRGMRADMRTLVTQEACADHRNETCRYVSSTEEYIKRVQAEVKACQVQVKENGEAIARNTAEILGVKETLDKFVYPGL